MDEAMLVLGESVDHLVTTDVKWPNAPLGHIGAIHEACRKLVGGPVCLAAAEAIRKKANKTPRLLYHRGFCFLRFSHLAKPTAPSGQLLSLVQFVMGLGQGLYSLPKRNLWGCSMRHAWEEGFRFIAPTTLGISRRNTILDFTREKKRAVGEAERILKEMNPSAVITVEKIGRNEKGIYHSARGSDMSQYVSGVDFLVEEAKRRGILTIGIGDLGNEIGLGSVADVAKSTIGSLGTRCNCGCGGGIVTQVGVEIPIMATMSNWGGYGVAACLAALLKRSDIFHLVKTGKRVIEECVRAGARDGVMVSSALSCDGVALEGNEGILQLLHEIVRVKLAASTPYRK